MKTPIAGALWPLPVVLGLWMFVVVQAVDIWLQPHRPASLTEQCAKLQLASASGLVSGGTLGHQR